MQQNSPITDAVLVTVQVKQSGASKLYFQDEKALTGKKIFAIEAFSNNDIATTPLGQPIINQSAFDRSFITITNSGKERIKDMPLRCLQASNNNGAVKQFADLEVDFQKSYISFGDTQDVINDKQLTLLFYCK